jgi:F-type H+-transporting ATPase subunit epsilon
MQFDLVSPERRLASLQATEVVIPGAEGDLTAMPAHAPLITTLRPGVLRVVTPEGSESYAVTGGFAEINAAGATVLAERAVPAAEFTQALADELVAEAEAARRAAPPAAADAAAKQVADLVAMAAALGVSVRAPG